MVNLFFSQVEFWSFLEILETFEKTVYLTVFKITVIKTNNSKISKNDRNLICKKKQIDYILPARFNKIIIIIIYYLLLLLFIIYYYLLVVIFL